MATFSAMSKKLKRRLRRCEAALEAIGSTVSNIKETVEGNGSALSRIQRNVRDLGESLNEAKLEAHCARREHESSLLDIQRGLPATT